MINSKKAITLTPNEIIELILVIAGMFLLIVAFLAFTNPGFDTNKETAKSYLATLEKETQKADDGKTGEFEIWQGDFYLVYFGNKLGYEFNNIAFKSSVLGFGKNKICICYAEGGKGKCPSCKSLEYPVRRDYFDAPLAIRKGEKMEIKKGDGYYSFLTPV